MHLGPLAAAAAAVAGAVVALVVLPRGELGGQAREARSQSGNRPGLWMLPEHLRLAVVLIPGAHLQPRVTRVHC
jgi:hypothetical protein